MRKTQYMLGRFWELFTWIFYILMPSKLHSMNSKSLKDLYLSVSCGREQQCRRSTRRKIRFIEKEDLVHKVRSQIIIPALAFGLLLVFIILVLIIVVKYFLKRRQRYRTVNLAWILKEIVLQVGAAKFRNEHLQMSYDVTHVFCLAYGRALIFFERCLIIFKMFFNVLSSGSKSLRSRQN